MIRTQEADVLTLAEFNFPTNAEPTTVPPTTTPTTPVTPTTPATPRPSTPAPPPSTKPGKDDQPCPGPCTF